MKKAFFVKVLTILVILLLVACSPATAPTSASEPETSEEEAEAEAAQAEGEDTTKVVLLLPGRIDDKGWNQSAYEALMSAKEILGVDEATYVELIAPADWERNIRQYASMNYDLILGHNFAATDPLLKVAPEFPDLWFGGSSVYDTTTNVLGYDIYSHGTSYLAGMLAAGMSETGTIATVMGVEVPSLVMDIEGFRMGAKAINPDIKVITSFTNDFQDPVKGKDATLSVISVGADVIYVSGNPMDLGVVEAVKEKDVYMVGRVTDQYEMAPDNILTSVIRTYEPIYVAMIGDLVSGNLTEKSYNFSNAEGATYLAPYHNLDSKIPDDLKSQIEEASKKIVSGELEVPAITSLTE